MVQDKQVYFCHSADVQSERPSSRLEQNMLNVRRKCCHSRGAADTSCQRNMSSKYSSNSSSLDRCYKENHRNVSSCHVTATVKCFVYVASNSGSVSAKLLGFFFVGYMLFKMKWCTNAGTEYKKNKWQQAAKKTMAQKCLYCTELNVTNESTFCQHIYIKVSWVLAMRLS